MLVIRGVDIRVFSSRGTRRRQKRGRRTVRRVVTSALQEQGPAYLGLDFGTSGARAVCISGETEHQIYSRLRDTISWPM